MELLPVLIVLGIGAVAFLLILVAFVMVAVQGGWRKPLPADGRWPLPRKLLYAGAALGLVFGVSCYVLTRIPGAIPWMRRP
jgi:hypothetical protein